MANMIEQSLLCKVLDAPDLEILHSNGVVEEMFLTCKDEIHFIIDGTLKISVKKNRYGINNKEVLMIWEVNTGYLKPLLSENPEESTEDKKDDKPDGEKDKGGEKDYGF